VYLDDRVGAMHAEPVPRFRGVTTGEVRRRHGVRRASGEIDSS
jgi:hypothetical protein